jgi:triosephosphate isomerase
MYLANYANEAAYREDTRRWSNGEIFTDILMKCGDKGIIIAHSNHRPHLWGIAD